MALSAKRKRYQIDKLIEHKCAILGKSTSSRTSAFHLEQWLKGKFDSTFSAISDDNGDEGYNFIVDDGNNVTSPTDMELIPLKPNYATIGYSFSEHFETISFSDSSQSEEFNNCNPDESQEFDKNVHHVSKID